VSKHRVAKKQPEAQAQVKQRFPGL